MALIIFAYHCVEALDMHDCILDQCKAVIYMSTIAPSQQHEVAELAWLMLQKVSLPGSDYLGNQTEKRSSNPSGVLSRKNSHRALGGKKRNLSPVKVVRGVVRGTASKCRGMSGTRT